MSKSARSISDYLPDHSHEEETVLFQAKVRKSLKREFMPILKAKDNTMIEFIEGAMQKFIDENKGKRIS